jgi:short-subunit dehydrogenase
VSDRSLALVTGVTRPAGLHLARLMAGNDFDLVVVGDDLSIDQVVPQLRALGVQVNPIFGGLETPEAVEYVMEQVHEDGRTPAVAAFCADARLDGAFITSDMDEQWRLVTANCAGTVYLFQLVARDMLACGTGEIMLTAPAEGEPPPLLAATYVASRAFIRAFATQMRGELERSSVTVTVLEPPARA